MTNDHKAYNMLSAAITQILMHADRELEQCRQLTGVATAGPSWTACLTASKVMSALADALIEVRDICVKDELDAQS
jgi:hypothetical protein